MKVKESKISSFKFRNSENKISIMAENQGKKIMRDAKVCKQRYHVK